MSARVTLGSMGLAMVAVVAIACATQGGSEPEKNPPDRDATDASDAAPRDASEDRPPAGPCAASGVCTVLVPINAAINVTSISGSGAGDVWAVGTDRTILHYDGVVWEKAAPIEYEASTFTMRAVWAPAPDDVWIADGPLLRHATGWRGPNDTEWTSAALAGTATATPSALGGKDGRVFIGRHFRDNFQDAALVIGEGWEDVGVREPIYLRGSFGGVGRNSTGGIWSLAVTRADEVWLTLVGGTNGARNTSNPGARAVRVYVEPEDAGGGDAGVPVWKIEEHDSRTPKNLYGVWGDESVVWMVGEGSTIRRMTRERVTTRVFEIVPAPGIADLRDVYGFRGDDVWAVGDDATILHWDGSTWTALATPFDGASDKPRLFAVWGSGPNDVWIGGNGVMLHFTGTTP